MKPRFFLKTLAWGAALVSVTAFSKPVISAVHSVHGASVSLGCDKCADWGNNHIFEGVGANFDCDKLNSCHNNMQTGWCSQYHLNCQAEDEASLLHENQPVTTARLAEIAASSDGATVATFLTDNADRVQYNADRQVLQLIGCGGKIYAQYPVSETVAAAFE